MFKKFKAVERKLNPNIRKVIHNVSWLSGERLLSMTLTFFVGIYVIRYLGPDSFGKLSYGISFVYLFSALSKLGLDSVIIRDLVRYEDRTNKILGTSFIIKTIASLVTIATIILAVWTVNPDPQVRWMTSIIALRLAFDPFEVIDYWFQSKTYSKPIVIVKVVRIFLLSLAKILVVFWQLPLIVFAWLVLADFAVGGIGTVIVYFKEKQTTFSWLFNRQLAIELLTSSWPLIFSSIMISIYLRIDQIMLGNMTNDVEVGNYAAAIKFSQIWGFIPVSICSSVFPAIVRAREKSREEYHNKLQILFDCMAWLSFLIALPITFFAKDMVIFLLGERYIEAGQILTFHVWANVFIFLNLARDKWLMAENYTKLSFLVTSLGAISNILINLLLIPEYGGTGAAIATIISYAIASHICGIFCPPMWQATWMLTKSLFIPFRWRQNRTYWNFLKGVIGKQTT